MQIYVYYIKCILCRCRICEKRKSNEVLSSTQNKCWQAKSNFVDIKKNGKFHSIFICENDPHELMSNEGKFKWKMIAKYEMYSFLRFTLTFTIFRLKFSHRNVDSLNSEDELVIGFLTGVFCEKKPFKRKFQCIQPFSSSKRKKKQIPFSSFYFESMMLRAG